ncbi:MAG: apolipoprotein N-acyltransferase [Alphaproteobacteria bacterium]
MTPRPTMRRPAGFAGRLDALARRVAALEGRRRWLVAAAAGAAAALAMPPANVVPVLALSFPVLLWLVDGARTGRAAFAAGWWFGFGFFVVGLYWIANALLIEPERFAWLIPFAVCGLPAVLAVFTGIATLLQRRFGGRGAARIAMLAVLWSAMEWMRGHVFTGFPWNLIGYAWTDSTAMLQATALTGIYGLSLLTVLAAAAPAALVGTPRGKAPDGATDGGATVRLRPGLPVAMAAVLALVWAGGAVRLAGADPAAVEGVGLRIVQANIPQRLKWDEDERIGNIRRHLELSVAPPRPGAAAPTLIVWPETAVPLFLNAEPEIVAAIASIAPPGGAVVTGAPRIERRPGAEPRIWNSILAIDPDGAVVATYDKFHLVPFGEYMPLRDWIGLDKITPGSIDFSPGPGPRTIDLPGAPPVSPLVCYEAIFPGNVTAPGEAPAWMLNVTNDGWYGRSAGPHQHLQIARVRAVEEGLPLVRAANTGISAVIDAHGRIVARLGLDEAGVIDAPLPRAPHRRTLYAWIGDGAFAALILVIGVAARLYGRRG